eukprot:scaffold105044_cov60-Phaeocystis_antarctica.AAC.4
MLRRIYFINHAKYVTWETPHTAQRFTQGVCVSRGSGCQLGYLGFSEGAKRVIESTACSGPPSVQGEADAGGGGQFDSRGGGSGLASPPRQLCRQASPHPNPYPNPYPNPNPNRGA